MIVTELTLHQKTSNKMKPKIILFLIIQILRLSLFHAQAFEFSFPDNANQELPPGVPRVVETNGKVLFIDSKFTTPAFQDEGLRLVIQEANKVASELHLQEASPITISNLTHAFIGPFGFTYKTQALGNITTSNYWYAVAQNYKFSELVIADYDKRSVNYLAKQHLPVNKINTNAAYQLATQWLSAVHMDVDGLNRDCDLHISLSSDLDGTQRPRGEFTPVYFVNWTPKVPMNRYDRGAYVELFLPTQTLLQLKVSSEKFILRPPLRFTNLASLFPGKIAITTNKPVEVKIMDANPPDRPK